MSREIRRRYTELITIQNKVTTIDAYGSDIEAWVDVISLPANFIARNSQSGNEEFFDSRQEQVRRRANFIIRKPYGYTITELMRIVYEGIIYDIEKVEDEGEIAPKRLKLYSVSYQTPNVEPYRPANLKFVLMVGNNVLVINSNVLILEI